MALEADGRTSTLRDHRFFVAGGRVTEPGPALNFEDRRHAGALSETLPAARHIVLPGLVNTLHHLYQSRTACLPAAQNERLFR